MTAGYARSTCHTTGHRMLEPMRPGLDTVYTLRAGRMYHIVFP